tara:strand:+ start:141 stop:380 length:240 start_codon:yes stop_codon:yes gene_type:complete
MKDNKKIIKLVEDLYFEYDRMSSSGKETLDKISTLLGINVEDDIDAMVQELLDMGCPKESLGNYLTEADYEAYLAKGAV